jgi:hypothetical protein
VIGVGEGQPQIRIPIWALDATRFASDEDRIEAYKFDSSKSAWVRALPGFEDVDWPRKGDNVGDWANANHEIVDLSEWAWVSLNRGSVAYRGSIPPSALRLADELDREWETAAEGDPWSPENAKLERYRIRR